MRTLITFGSFTLLTACQPAVIKGFWPAVDTAGDTDADSDTDTNVDSDSGDSHESDTDTDSDSQGDADTDADADTDTDTDADADTDSDTDADSDSDADTDTDTAKDTSPDSSGDTSKDTSIDTAVPPDTGIPGDTSDTGVPPDTGIPGDTGVPPDTGPSDTGTPPVDADGDGYYSPSDCDDTDGTIFPGAVELCDFVDNDCDGLVDNDAIDATYWYADADNDGHGDPARATTSCTEPAGYTASSDDCNDLNADMSPDDVEHCDGLDNDCDGTADGGDWDLDGHTVCDDCDDSNPYEFNGGVEVCDGFDNDCNGLVDDDATDGYDWYADSDGDSYGNATAIQNACTQPLGYVADALDCDDANAAINPAATENSFTVTDETCDGVSMNDGTVYTANNGGTLVFTGANQFSNADFADASDLAGWTLEVTPDCTAASGIDSGDASIVSADFTSTAGSDANGLLFVTSSGYCNPSDVCYRSLDVDMVPDTEVALHYNVGSILSGGMTMKGYLASDYDSGLPDLYELSESIDYGEQIVLHTLATQSSDAWVICAGVDRDNSIVIGDVFTSSATVTP